MRAARLLTMMLTLQRRGRMTAQELADLLEVSPRTVLRDVEALSEAGLPVVTTQGYGGGIALLDGVRGLPAQLSHDAAEALWLVGFPALAAALGMRAGAQAARTAVGAALPEAVLRTAAALETWLHVDLTAADDALDAALAVVARAAREGLEISVPAAAGGREVLAPLALVHAGTGWWLLHTARAGSVVRAVPVAGLGEVRLLGTTFTRPEGFDPAQAWAALGRGPAAVRP
ncbi:YafY family protein [Kineosporia sp. A_224]|uniref:helix-turn-helix transcriptional regulator n=1 Tax=Kineosporia sp. A_224 TaxID=1962180 RepID=UPI000B4A59F9|nr:HTH domain-containing protein [Kineosporia sp. A_224]